MTEAPSSHRCPSKAITYFPGWGPGGEETVARTIICRWLIPIRIGNSYNHSIIGLHRPSYGAVEAWASESAQIGHLRPAHPQSRMRNIVPRPVCRPGNPAAIVDAVPGALRAAERIEGNYFVHDLRSLRSE